MPFNNASINIAAQSDFMRKHGEWVRYFIGMKCTCTLMMTGSNVPDSNRADPSCMACKGIGWVWQENGQILGIVENINQHKELLMAGLAAPGDMVFLPDLRYTLSDFDKIQLTWKEGIPFDGELIVRGADGDPNTDPTVYGVMSVTKCVVIDPTTGAITTFVAGLDFTFSGNSITWISDNQPPLGTVYSIKYQALVDWIAFSPPQPRRERGTSLGQRVILRKKHVAFGA